MAPALRRRRLPRAAPLAPPQVARAAGEVSRVEDVRQALHAAAGDALTTLSRGADLVLLGEDAGDPLHTQPRIASIALHWFGPQSPLRHWRGSDLAVQALTGMPQMAGTVDGPPLSAGDRQATLLAGVTAYIAACAALLGAARQPGGGPRRGPPRRWLVRRVDHL
jgi:hypothetical protein